MARFDFRSPTAAAGDAVSRYFADLDNRRRQKEQDQLARDREVRLVERDKEQSAIARAQLEGLNESRQSAADTRKQQAAEAEQKSAADALTLTGIGGGVSPELMQRAQVTGLGGMTAPAAPAIQGRVTPETNPEQQQGIYPGIIASSAPSVGNAGPATAGFSRGTAKERETADAQARREAHLQTLDPTSPQAKFLAAQIATGDTSLPYQMFQDETGRIVRAGRDGKLQVQDPTTGQLRPFGPGDKPFDKTQDQLINEPAPSGGGNTTVNMGSDAVDMAAWQYLQTGTLPPLGMGAGNLRSQILERAAALSKQAQGGGNDAINPQANAMLYGADKQALNQLNRTLTAISAFESTAQKNIGQMQAAMSAVTDTGIPILNAPIREVQRMAGSPEVAKYQASIRVVIPELARILTQPSLAGQLTDQARHEIEGVVRGDATVEQANAVIGLLLQDMVNRKAGLVAEREALMGGVRKRGPAGMPGMVAPSATPTESPDQRRARLKNYMPPMR